MKTDFLLDDLPIYFEMRTFLEYKNYNSFLAIPKPLISPFDHLEGTLSQSWYLHYPRPKYKFY